MSTYSDLRALAAHGITIRKANRFEEQTNEYGEKLRWVIDMGGHMQSQHPYATQKAALEKAMAMYGDLLSK